MKNHVCFIGSNSSIDSGLFKENITGNAVEDLSAKEIKVRAFQFGYDPMTITVNKGNV